MVTYCSHMFPEAPDRCPVDNSVNHGVACMAHDVLIASRLIVNDGCPELATSDKEAGMIQTAFRNTKLQDDRAVVGYCMVILSCTSTTQCTTRTPMDLRTEAFRLFSQSGVCGVVNVFLVSIL